jgi:hypothetical protein
MVARQMSTRNSNSDIHVGSVGGRIQVIGTVWQSEDRIFLKKKQHSPGFLISSLIFASSGILLAGTAYATLSGKAYT